MKEKINIMADSNIPYLQETLNKYAPIHIFSSKDLDNKTLIEKEINILFVRTALKVNEELLKNTKVKFVATATSGIDHFDTKYLDKNNITYANALGSNSNSVAEYVVFSILLWAKENNIIIKDKTIGIIGYGNIGKKVYKYSKSLGLNIILNDPPLKDNNYSFPEDAEYMELEELLIKSDIVTNHVPRNLSGKYQTISLLNKNNLNLLNSNSLFIHASRGNVVRETALLEIVTKKNITTVIDVWKNEPYFNIDLSDHSILATPHIAGHSYEGKILGTKMVIEAFEKFSGTIVDYSIINEKLSPYKPMLIEIYNDLDCLFETIDKSRKLFDDFNFMKYIKNIPIDDAMKYFLDYRQNYPITHEVL